MHFFKVPRLGSYLAIRLEYKSCLFEEALDAAVSDYLEVKQRQKEQDDEKRSFMEKMSQEEKDNEDGDKDASILASGRKWEEIKAKSFRTQTVSLVVCLNTLGQDREYTQDEIRFA
jgi:predicted RecB family endonuclease